MHESVMIAGDRVKLELEVLGRENFRSQNADDYNWLRANMNIIAGSFGGSITFGVTVPELTELYNQLADGVRTLSGEIRFVTMEGNWALNVTFERTGTAVLNGVVTSSLVEDNSLHYEFRTDGITLEAALQSLRRVLTQYPPWSTK